MPTKNTLKQEHVFFNICQEEFGFLVDKYGFEVVAKRKETGNILNLIFQNRTTAVIVKWERNENWICVELYRLVNGELVLDSGKVNFSSVLNGYYLDDLLSIRHPGFLTSSLNNENEVLNAIAIYSKGLRDHGADILTGDFSIFHDLEKMVKGRLSRKLQQQT